MSINVRKIVEEESAKEWLRRHRKDRFQLGDAVTINNEHDEHFGQPGQIQARPGDDLYKVFVYGAGDFYYTADELERVT